MTTTVLGRYANSPTTGRYPDGRRVWLFVKAGRWFGHVEIGARAWGIYLSPRALRWRFVAAWNVMRGRPTMAFCHVTELPQFYPGKGCLILGNVIEPKPERPRRTPAQRTALLKDRAERR